MITAPIASLVRPDTPSATGPPKAPASTDAVQRAAAGSTQPLSETGETVVISSNPEAGKYVAPDPPSGQSEAPSPEEALSERIREINLKVQQRATQVEFTIDRDTDNVVVRVLNKETGEVIREIPPEEIINLRQALEDIRGLMLSRMS
ncbi:flagellar protein FlaG [Candidatus Sumerlaeota bacterium]|nr:flagellar protein FlaG [Candidatus Sumerlaeota bacterium]